MWSADLAQKVFPIRPLKVRILFASVIIDRVSFEKFAILE
jgi:hypothetical protein